MEAVPYETADRKETLTRSRTQVKHIHRECGPLQPLITPFLPQPLFGCHVCTFVLKIYQEPDVTSCRGEGKETALPWKPISPGFSVISGISEQEGCIIAQTSTEEKHLCGEQDDPFKRLQEGGRTTAQQ